ncbi:oxidoreductase, aldo/keto reductase family protein [Trichomonas vaginalis G3]|uniref:Oxidoreductase, aldo/keto reductase family protein n=1 Tax=Trichomonas vaginalis (strain ATCC PRA-98 / G3) TaxID=412133 RepID=A2FJP7_TRIV3|nr:oxidoreductase protein [Trichomonas vaginalis G3]EAX94879.1 oxidoreductase, aldo/keto reductase family protein [Trichomonas vaginalis G3]KAI5541497.1 oxidoreductase protein [Trichomonas vaginalis G3]|eukprot:XP_001307809.1 oxidoreductase, aldo/keto reductase family protein [Trichomonas vaginalis G3]
MELPQLGFGTYNATDPAKLKAALHYAIEECGVSEAWAYFNQKVVGETLKEIFAKGKIKREDLFITSKVWGTHHRKELVEPELRETLQDLQLDYIDLFLMHNIVAFKPCEGKVLWEKNEKGQQIYEAIDILETYKAMEECQKKGLTRYIGVSNFSIEQLERVWFNCEIKPYANQVECNIYRQCKPLLEYCESHNIYLVAHTPLGHPPLIGPFGTTLLEDPVVKSVAESINKTTAQVCLKFLQQKSKKYILIPMSMNPKNIKADYELDFELSSDNMSKLESLDRFYSFYNFSERHGVDSQGTGSNKWVL